MDMGQMLYRYGTDDNGREWMTAQKGWHGNKWHKDQMTSEPDDMWEDDLQDRWDKEQMINRMDDEWSDGI
jgi:hypothetical protein